LGRTFTPDDDRVPGGHPAAMLSYACWQTRFASDPSTIGKNIEVNAHKYTVMGVAPLRFDASS
jgi:hypothetical protein